jgi:hypothetical protein
VLRRRQSGTGLRRWQRLPQHARQPDDRARRLERQGAVALSVG